MSHPSRTQQTILPYSSKLIDVTALALTLSTVFVVTRLEGTKWAYLNLQLNYRGPIQWLILYTIYRNAYAGIMALRASSLPDVHFRQALTFSLLPCLLGLMGTVQGLSKSIRGLGMFLAMGAGTTSQEMVEAVSNMFAGSGVALDTLYFGLLGSFLCLGLHIKTLSKQAKNHLRHSDPTPKEAEHLER